MNFPGILNRVFQAEYLRLRWPKLWGIGPLFSGSDKPAEVEAISGACMLMRREVFESVGGFSDEYFMYSEDLDLCYQCLRSGFTNYYMNEGRIIHYGGKSSSRAWQTAMKTAAEVQFCERNYGYIYTLLFRTGLIVNAALRIVLIKILSTLRTVPVRASGEQCASSKIENWKVVLKTLLGRIHSQQQTSRPIAEVSCPQL
jgi:GT2 family glycosyltransferase